MKSNPVIVGTLLVGLVSILSGCGGLLAGEWEYRARMEFTGPLEEHLDIRMMTELRSGDGFLTHKESHFDLGLEWGIRKWLGVAPYYRSVSERKGSLWRVEHRPHFNVTLKWSMMGMQLSDRSRLEYRMIGADQTARYRNRIMLDLRSAGIPRISVHMSTEPYYNFSVGKIEKNRMIAGFDLRVFGATRLSFEYVLDSIRLEESWHEVNSLLMAFKYRP